MVRSSRSGAHPLIVRQCRISTAGPRRCHFLLGQALQPVSAATTVRMRNGRVSVTDGPFAETKEQLAGFILIEARDLNDAIQVASRIPSARVGSIEIRPTRELMAPTHAAAV